MKSFNVTNQCGQQGNCSREDGSAILEFITIFLLLAIPVISQFSQSTRVSSERMKTQEVLREVRQIIASEENFYTIRNIAQRYIELQGVSGTLQISCESGACPGRGSVIRIEIENYSGKYATNIKGGRWT